MPAAVALPKSLNNLANRVFETYEDIVNVCCFASNTLIGMPQRLASITLREWAQFSLWCRWYQLFDPDLLVGSALTSRRRDSGGVRGVDLGRALFDQFDNMVDHLCV